MALVPLVLAFLTLGSGACVLPLPYEQEQVDSGAKNHMPVIVAAKPKMPDPITLDSATLGSAFSIDVHDGDIGDTIYVRVFRDYTKDNPTPPWGEVMQANDPEVGTEVRTIELDNRTWCNLAQRNATLIIDVMVADRPFVSSPSVPPFFRALSDPEGLSSIGSWLAVCPE